MPADLPGPSRCHCGHSLGIHGSHGCEADGCICPGFVGENMPRADWETQHGLKISLAKPSV